MRKTNKNSLVLSGLVSLLSLAAWPAERPATSVFGPGEQAVYEVTYLGVAAGTVQVTVGSEVQQPNGRVWPIVVIARSGPLLTFYPVRDKFVTYWDPRAQLSLNHELVIDENHKRVRQVVRLDPQTHTAQVTRQREGHPDLRLSQSIVPGTMDMAAATYAIRNRPLSLGAKLEIPIFTGKKNFVLKVQIEGRKLLHTALGDKEAFQARVQTEFSGKLRARNDILAYFSSDPQHLLLRVESNLALGTLIGELTDFKPGQEQRLAGLPP